MRRSIRLLILAAALSAPLPATAAAESFPVTNPASSGTGTLREAIELANAEPGPDTIPIDVTGAIVLETALPPITESVEIAGPGAGLLTVRRAAAPMRIFDLGPTAAAVSISGLTIRNGRAPSGAGINNAGGSLTLTGVVVTGNVAVAAGTEDVVVHGGGIFSSGPLTLRESVVSENLASANNATKTVVVRGGGLVAAGALTIDRSTIAGNTAIASGGELAFAEAGGVEAMGEPTLIERSTISGNKVEASAADAREAVGGGVVASEGIEMTSSTLSGNAVVAPSTASANLEAPGTSLLRNTIVANPIGTESCGSSVVSGGYNLDEDGSCGFGEGSDLANVVPLLGPLADNGGPTPTHALLTGSIAIDRGNSFGADTDQRGFPRPSDFPAVSDKEGGDGSDIGAFELQAPPPFGGGAVPIQVQVLSGDRQPPNTRIVSGPARVGFKRLAKFRFASTEAQSRFQCKVDKGRWRGCRNPFKRKVSAAGGNGKKHVFKVRAIDRFGNVDRTPARFGWRVKAIGR